MYYYLLCDLILIAFNWFRTLMFLQFFVNIPPSEGCFSDVRGPFRSKDPPKYQNNPQYKDCSHFWDIFLKVLKRSRKMFLNHVPI